MNDAPCDDASVFGAESGFADQAGRADCPSGPGRQRANLENRKDSGGNLSGSPAQISEHALRLLSSAGSVTKAFRRLDDGDSSAYAVIVEHFWQNLVKLAGWKLPPHRRRAFDQEDAAQESLLSFWNGVCRGQFKDVRHREDIFRILAGIVFHKVFDLLKKELAVKRGGGKVRGDSAFDAKPGVLGQENVGESGSPAGPASEPKPGVPPEVTPAEQAELKDLVNRLLQTLPEKGRLRAIGQTWLLDGMETAADIKGKLHLDVDERTVQRKKETILKIWRKELESILESDGE